MAESSSVGEERTNWATESKSAPQSTLTLDGVELEDVPGVEVKTRVSSDTPVQATSVGGEIAYCQLNPEQQKDFEERIKREQAKRYFSLREGAFEKALEECKKTAINLATDGSLLSSWLLTEIDHWDLEKERIVLVTEKKLIIVKYNFIGLRVDDCRKIPLIKCDKVQVGRFIYPRNTMMMLTGYADYSPRTKQNGLRVQFGDFQPSLLQSWNPWSDEIPYVTFGSHTLCQLVQQPPEYFQLPAFQKAIVDAISAARNAASSVQTAGHPLQVTEEEIPIWLYLPITAMINNQSKLGYCKDRGNVFW